MAKEQDVMKRTVAEAIRQARLLFQPKRGNQSSTGNASTTQSGLVPPVPNDATKFLNGVAPPAFAQVKGSDLAMADVTTNDVDATKHGFCPKAPGDTSKFLRGDGTWATSGTVAWVSDDCRTPPSPPNALDDEFEGANGAAINAAWTYVGAAGGTAALDGRGNVILTAPALGSNSFRAWVKTPPATPWSIMTRCSLGNFTPSPSIGLILRNSTSGKAVTLGTTMTGNLAFALSGFNMTNLTTWSGNVVTQISFPPLAGPTYFKIVNDGTNLKLYVSWTGTQTSHWMLITSVTLASFIGSVDQVGIFVDAQNASVAGVAIVDFFRVTSP
ncbi:MAG TPA: hypothetical protein VFZ98_00045 [Vicinamibacterales bacterium]